MLPRTMLSRLALLTSRYRAKLGLPPLEGAAAAAAAAGQIAEEEVSCRLCVWLCVDVVKCVCQIVAAGKQIHENMQQRIVLQLCALVAWWW